MPKKTDVETEMERQQRRIETLSVQKAELEVRNLRSEIWLRPMGFLTPLVLAAGVYLLVQNPSTLMQGRGQCLAEMNILRELSNPETTPRTNIMQAFEQYSFSCESSQEYFRTLSAFEDAATSLESSQTELAAVDNLLADFSPKPGPDTWLQSQSTASRACEQALVLPHAAEIDLLGNELATLVEVREALQTEYRDALDRVHLSMRGLDATGIAACGPICRTSQLQAATILAESEGLLRQSQEIEQALAEAHTRLESGQAACLDPSATLPGFGLDQ